VVHRLAEVAAGERVAVAIGAAVIVWLVAYALSGFPDWMATALEVCAAATTMVMVFVIQHTQHRVELATQLKLDELVRVTDADDDIAQIESADGDELERKWSRTATRH
jgi:low affinity Fe/Cu permease